MKDYRKEPTIIIIIIIIPYAICPLLDSEAELIGSVKCQSIVNYVKFAGDK